MIDPNLIDQFTKDHQKNQLSKEEAKAFLLDVMRVCKKHGVLLRTADQTVKFTKGFQGSNMQTILQPAVDKDGTCSSAKVVYKGI
ncbi:MAG: hypothetical protein HOL85_06845 [Rhodospirillaceae bacterium]|jgi:hypothetical protein|nr:hypothetical protein [Rhodospirillaceae bacterium]MBT6137676.1 hypothetical protein [Rhodospirillaceae bacterium]